MGVFSWLKSLFTQVDSAPHAYIPSTLTFNQLDTASIAKKRRLRDEGMARGENEQPPTNQRGLDAIEAGIETLIRGEVAISQERFARQMRAYGERQAALKVSGHLSQLVTQADSARSDFSERVGYGRDLIWQLANDLVASDEELKRFRQQHRLERLPRFPQSRVLHFGIIAVLVVVESALNGTFLARGSELGLFGGVTQAIVIAVLNVGLGLAAGRLLLPSIWHRAVGRKIVGVLGIAAWFCAAFVFNLGVAHYRSAQGSGDPSQAERLALQNLVSSPFTLSEINDWLLFLLGFAFSLIAAADGYKMDDPYPGYGSLTRRRDRCRDEYTEQKQELSSELKRVRDGSVAKMDELVREVESGSQQYKNIHWNRAHMVDQFTTHLRDLQQCGRELLAIYRQANVEARRTPPPEHFTSEWELPQNLQITHDAGPGNAALDDRITKAFDEIKAVRKYIEEQYQGALKEFHSVESLVRQETRENAAATAS